jgi:hypothetical protein
LCQLSHVSQLLRPGTNEWDEVRIRQYFHPWDVDEIM